MWFRSKQTCPKCGNKENGRIPRQWHMHFYPGSKHYECINCGHRFLIRPWSAAPFILFACLIKAVIWVAWDFSGLRFFSRTLVPARVIAPFKRPPSTFLIWVAGISALYMVLFGIAKHGYYSRINLIENRARILLSQLPASNDSAGTRAMETAPSVPQIACYEKPNLFVPASVFGYFFRSPDRPHEPTLELLKTRAGLDSEIENNIRENHPHLLNPPDGPEIGDEEAGKFSFTGLWKQAAARISGADPTRRSDR